MVLGAHNVTRGFPQGCMVSNLRLLRQATSDQLNVSLGTNNLNGSLAEWLKAPDCRLGEGILRGGSNPSASTLKGIYRSFIEHTVNSLQIKFEFYAMRGEQSTSSQAESIWRLGCQRGLRVMRATNSEKSLSLTHSTKLTN